MFEAITKMSANISVPAAQGYDTFSSIGIALANLMIIVGFGFGLFSIAYSALSFILSAGNPDKTKIAWNAFLYGVVACMVALATVFLRNLVVGVYGVGNTVLF